MTAKHKRVVKNQVSQTDWAAVKKKTDAQIRNDVQRARELEAEDKQTEKNKQK